MYEKWLDLLTQTELFKNIEREELLYILNCIKPRIGNYEVHELIEVGHSGITDIGIILEGEVAVIKDNFAGDRVLLDKLGVGDLFGGLAAFAEDKELATIDPLKESTILFLPPSKVTGMCSEVCPGHENLVRNMLEIISKKAVNLNKRLETISLKSIRSRISHYLLQQYKVQGKLTFSIPLKRYELAEALNIPRPSLSRELTKMRDEGIVDFHRNSFEIKDLKSLQASVAD